MKTTTKTAEVGNDLVITSTTHRASGGGIWAQGSLNGYRFEALVFRDHADHPDYELGKSRISKFCLREQNGGESVVNFDRGWDTRPKTRMVRAIVDFLAANLADLVYPT